MNDPTDIEINLMTKGDTSGAEAVEKSIKDVGEAAKDVEKAATPVNDNEANLRGRAVAWAQVGEKLREYGASARQAAGEMEGLDQETQKLVEKVGAATETVGGYLSTISQGFAAGGPIGAVLAAASTGVGDFIKAWGSAGTEIDKANKKSEESVVMWQRLQQLKINLPIVEALETANRLLDDQLEKLERNARVAESARALDQARQESAGADAVRSGSQTPEGAAASNLELASNNQIAAIQDKLNIATAAQAELESAANTLKEQIDRGLVDSKDLPKKIEELNSLEAKARQGAQKLIDDKQIGENQIATIREKTEEQAKQFGDAALDALTQSTIKQRDALKAEVDRLGVNASAGARASLAILDGILQDGQVRAEELKKYSEAQGRLNGMFEKSNAAVLEGFAAGERNLNAIIDKIEPMLRRLENAEIRISYLQ